MRTCLPTAFPEDTLIPNLASLSAGQILVLQNLYDIFRPKAVWPTFGFLDRSLYVAHQVDLQELLSEMPKGLVAGDETMHPESKIRLLLRGFTYCSKASDDTVLFMAFVRWVVEQDRAFKPESPDSSEALRLTADEFRRQQLSTGRTVTEPELQRLYEMIATESTLWTTLNQGRFAGDWSLKASRGVRRYSDAFSIDEYLARRDAPTSFQQTRGLAPESAVANSARHGVAFPAQPSVQEAEIWASGRAQAGDTRTVFIVHGANVAAKEAMKRFLRALDLKWLT
jgi:hypothetical protein